MLRSIAFRGVRALENVEHSQRMENVIYVLNLLTIVNEFMTN